MRNGTRQSASAASFAHLITPTRAAAARAEDETEDEKKEREDKERTANQAATGHAETDEEREKREDEEEAARAAEEDEGDDNSDKDEMRGQGQVARARARERGRVRAILSSPIAARNIAVACELACNTTQSREEALRVLGKTLPAGRADRSARNPQLGPSAPLQNTGPGQIQAMWDRAFAPYRQHSARR